MRDLFLSVLEVSISGSLIILLLLLCAPFLNKRYAAKWKYLMWIALALRLAIPFQFDLPLRQLTIPVPTQITLPAEAVSDHAAMPVATPVQGDPQYPTQPSALTAPKMLDLSLLLDLTAVLWATGAVIFLSLHLFNFLHYRKQIVRNGMRPENEAVFRQMRKLSEELRINPDVRVIQYPVAGSPMLIGFRKPLLVLPDCDHSEDELYFILKHELIHLKRHDIYFKLLFVLAGAMHWFNPLVYLMRREAVVDMELSCDEKVVWQTDYACRKAYTETLFSSLNRQYNKGTHLSTQFYGGKKIMTRRFINILDRMPKKNGLPVCTCVICLTLVSGTLIGCAAPEPSSIAAATANNTLSVENNDSVVMDPPQEPATADDANSDVITVKTDSEEFSFDKTTDVIQWQMAYLKGFTDNTLLIDRVEWVQVPSERADELGITEDDAAGGFSVYDEESVTEELPLSPDCKITVLDWRNSYEPTEISVESFLSLLDDRGEQNEFIPYILFIESGVIMGIQEQYVP